MGLGQLVDRLATARIHILVLEIPGHRLLRMHAEAVITVRGWVIADAPADADVLLVCGDPTEVFGPLIEGLWNQIPGPRRYAQISTLDALPPAFDSLPALLGDRAAQLADARQRPKNVEAEEGTPAASGTETAQHDHQGHPGEPPAEGHPVDGHGGHPGPGDDPAHHNEPAPHETPSSHADMDDKNTDMDMDMGEMDMDHMDMDMSGPAGIALASGDDGDRDGLEMDITHLALGPILSHWPAGLVLRCTLHGDVVGEATAELLPGPGKTEPAMPFGDRLRAVELCDTAGHLLALAGWAPAAAAVHRARNELLSGTAPGPVAARLRRTIRRIARSRTLRWSLAGIPHAGRIDARTRLLDWLQTAIALLDNAPTGIGEEPWPQTLQEIGTAVIGQELTTVRLIIACIEPARIRELAVAQDG